MPPAGFCVIPFSPHFGATSEPLIARPVLTVGRVEFIEDGIALLFDYRFLISGSRILLKVCDTSISFMDWEIYAQTHKFIVLG